MTEDSRSERGRAIADDLRGGRRVTDTRFDQIYPAEVRKLSEIHWTPVEVAIRAAEMLGAREGARILDVGSGCGKFCIVAALSGRGSFTGIEQRESLVEVAREAARELGATSAEFVPGNMVEVDWSRFDAFYLFNPFAEHAVKEIRMDDAVSFAVRKFDRSVATVRERLEAARSGTRVVTYHGFGGDLPFGYRQALSEAAGVSVLDLWIKAEGWG